MAEENLQYWSDAIDYISPPQDWVRVDVTGYDIFFEGDSWLTERYDWLGDPTYGGYYCWHAAHVLDKNNMSDDQVWAFSDPNTAFAFKMRFG